MIASECSNLYLAIAFLTIAWAIAMFTNFFLMRTIRKLTGHDAR